MLTPNLINAFNKVSGGNVSPTATTPYESGLNARLAQIDSITKNATIPKQTTQPTNNLFGSGNQNTGNSFNDAINNGSSNVLNAVTGGVQTFGHALSTIGSSAPGEANDINTKDEASKQQLLQAIHNQPNQAMRQHLLDAYNKIWGGSQPLTAGDINPAFNLSKEQVVGSALETGLDVASAGTLSGAGEAAPATEGTLNGVLQGAKTGAKVGGLYGAGFGAAKGMQNNESPLGVAGSSLEGGATGVLGGALVGGVLGGVTAKPLTAATGNDVSTIAEKISPKLNSTEIGSALNEGRVTLSPTSGLKVSLLGKSPDIIAQSNEVKQAAQTIASNIPGAAKMDNAELYTALKSNVASNAQALQPAMEATPVSQSTLSSINDNWAQLKQAQKGEVAFANMPGSKVAQNKFENSFASVVNNPNPTLQDVWDARISYDNSVPANVKGATTLSPENLQWQKTMWLQNRSILNNAINSESTGLGTQSQKAFSDMSDLYKAQQNIRATMKIDTEGKPGILTKYLPTTKSGWVGLISVDAAGMYMLHKLGL